MGGTGAALSSARAHHVHAVVEDDLPQLLPAHHAQTVIILVLLLRETCILCALRSHASTFLIPAFIPVACI